MKAVGGESGNSESASWINLPSFACMKNVFILTRTSCILLCRVFCNLRPLKFRCSLVIHTVSKEIENEDGRNYQSVLFAIVNKVFELSDIRGVIINNRILEVFRKKIFSLEKTVEKASKCGGRQLNALLTKLEMVSTHRSVCYSQCSEFSNFCWLFQPP